MVSVSLLGACGGAAAPMPAAPRVASMNALKSSRLAILADVATPTPTPTPFNPTALWIQKDTSMATGGIFLGDACGIDAIVSCPNFADTFRHGIAYGTIYSTWDENLGTVITRNALSTWYAQGTIPEVTWQPESNKTSITLAAVANGTWDAYITASADQVKAFGQHIFLRPFHEFNGNSYPWTIGQNGDDATADTNFIKAWRRVVRIFRKEGATNAKFIWCFEDNASPNDQWNQPASAYPGDDYVDWVAFDGYNVGSATDGKRWVKFHWMVVVPYAAAVALAPDKPIMIAETASNEYGDGGPLKAAWIDAMFSELSSATNPFPSLRAVSWFEADKNTYLYDSKSTMPSYQSFVYAIRGRSTAGALYVRSNGEAMWSIKYAQPPIDSPTPAPTATP